MTLNEELRKEVILSASLVVTKLLMFNTIPTMHGELAVPDISYDIELYGAAGKLLALAINTNEKEAAKANASLAMRDVVGYLDSIQTAAKTGDDNTIVRNAANLAIVVLMNNNN